MINYDGRVDTNDDAFSRLQVWVDANQDGISIPQELHILSQLGITSLGLTLDTTGAASMNGNTITGYATVDYADGHQGSMAEVQLDFELAKQENRPVQDTDQASKALASDAGGVQPDYSRLAGVFDWEGVTNRGWHAHIASGYGCCSEPHEVKRRLRRTVPPAIETSRLIRQLQRRFGNVPTWASEKIAKAELPPWRRGVSRSLRPKRWTRCSWTRPDDE